MMKKAVAPLVVSSPSRDCGIAMRLMQAYLPSRLASVKAFAQGELPEDPFEDDKRIQIDMECLLYISCAEFDKISKYVLAFFDPILQKYKEAANWEVADAMLKELYVYEGQLAWLIHLMGMLVEGQLYLTRCIDNLFAGQWDLYPIGAGDLNPLIMRVAELFQVCNRGVPSQRGEELSKRRLDSVIQSFLENFQPVLFGDNDGMCTPVQDLRAKFLECGIDLKSCKSMESPEKADKKKTHWASLVKFTKRKKSKKILEERVIEEEMEKERVSSELALAQAECAIHQRQVDRLVSELQSLRRERQLWEESLEAMTVDIDSLKEKLEEKGRELAAMEGQMAKRQVEDQSIRTEMEVVKERLDSKQREFMEMVELWRKNEDEVRRLEMELADTKNTLEQKEREVEELVAELWVCEQEKQKLATKVEEIKTKLDEKEQVVEVVEAKLADSESERIRIAHQVKDISAKLNSREEELEKLVLVLRKGEEERKRWRERAEKGEEGIERLQKKLEQFVRESEWGDAARDAQTKAEMEQLRSWLEEKEKEVDEVKEELERVKEQRESWKDEARKMNQEALELRVRMEDWERERQVLQWKKQKEEEERNAELDGFRRWLEKKEMELKNLRSKMERAGLEKWRERVKKVEEEVHKMKELILKIERERGLGGGTPEAQVSEVEEEQAVAAALVDGEHGELDWEARVERVEEEVCSLRSRLEELLTCLQKVDEYRNEEESRQKLEIQELRESLKKKEREIDDVCERLRLMDFEKDGWSEKVLIVKEQVDDMRRALSITWSKLCAQKTEVLTAAMEEKSTPWEVSESDLRMFDYDNGPVEKPELDNPSAEEITEEGKNEEGAPKDAGSSDSILSQVIDALRFLRVDIARLEEQLLTSRSDVANLEASLVTVKMDSEKWKHELQLREVDCIEMSEQLDRKEGELREMAGGLEKVMESERTLRCRAEGAEELVALLRDKEMQGDPETGTEMDEESVKRALNRSTTRTVRLDTDHLNMNVEEENLNMHKEQMTEEESSPTAAAECNGSAACREEDGMTCRGRLINMDVYWLKRDVEFLKRERMAWTEEAAMHAAGADRSHTQMIKCQKELEVVEQQKLEWYSEAVMRREELEKIGEKLKEMEKELERKEKEIERVGREKTIWCEEAARKSSDAEEVVDKLRASQSKVEDLKSRLARAEEDKEWMENRIRQEAGERRRVQSELELARTEIDILKQDVKQLREKLADDILTMATVKGKSRAYQWRVNVLESEVMGMRSELERARGMASLLEEETGRLRNDLHQKEVEKEALRAKVQRREAYNALLKCELKFLLAKCGTKKTQNGRESETSEAPTSSETKDAEHGNNTREEDAEFQGIAKQFLEDVQLESCERMEKVQHAWRTVSEKSRRRRNSLMSSLKKVQDCRMMLQESFGDVQEAALAAA